MGSVTAKAKSKAKTKSKTRPAGEVDSDSSKEATWLRTREERRLEFRYAPASNAPELVGTLVWALGAVALGAGTWGQFFRPAGPHAWSVGLLVGGLVAALAGWFVTTRRVPHLRVGDAGLAVEGSKGLERLGWNEVEGIGLAAGTLTFRGHGGVLVNIPEGPHPGAFVRALVEARARIPAKASAVTRETGGKPNVPAEQIVLPAPQLAGLHCKASDKLIAFENDARLCGRCGETFHKETVPARCPSCDARLR